MGTLNLVSALIVLLLEHVAEDCLLPCSKCVPRDSAFPPACSIYHYCLSVSVCGRKLVGAEDLPKRSEESPVKSDQDGDCRWTTGSRRFGTVPMANLVLEQVYQAASKSGIRRSLCV